MRILLDVAECFRAQEEEAILDYFGEKRAPPLTVLYTLHEYKKTRL